MQFYGIRGAVVSWMYNNRANVHVTPQPTQAVLFYLTPFNYETALYTFHHVLIFDELCILEFCPRL